jgi:hypothetical protein
MIFRLLRLFFLRLLPGRLFMLLSVLDFILLARRMYRAASPSAVKPPPKVVGRSGFDDDGPADTGWIDPVTKRARW